MLQNGSCSQHLLVLSVYLSFLLSPFLEHSCDRKINACVLGNRAVFNVSKVISRLLWVLHYYALWLANKTRATFSTNGNPNQNQSCFRRTRFPALGASYMYLLRVLIGSLCCLHLLRLARVITLVLISRHSVGNRSKEKRFQVSNSDPNSGNDHVTIPNIYAYLC